MTSCSRFKCDDLFTFNSCNLDPWTETYQLSFYMTYMSHWPNFFQGLKGPSGIQMGYLMGKSEGSNKDWHGHVSALTVAPLYRRMGIAESLMHVIEIVSDKVCNCYFVDLFVRESNKVAIEMYKKFGYVVYREIIQYYTGENSEDAYDMRKPCSRDKEGDSIKPLKRPRIHQHEMKFD